MKNKIILYFFVLLVSTNLSAKSYFQLKVNKNFTNCKNKYLIKNSYNLNYNNRSNNTKNIVSSNSFFVDIGLGRTPVLFDGNGTSVGIFVYYSRKNNTFSVRSLATLEYFMKAGPEPVEVYSDLSLLWGYKFFSSKFHSIIPLIGAGKVTSIKKGKLLDEFSVNAKHEKLKENTFGISLGIKFLINTKYTAYSLYLFTDINSIKSYYGILLCFGLGKLY